MVTPASVLVVFVGSGWAVCGVTPCALLGVIGSSMCTGIGGIVGCLLVGQGVVMPLEGCLVRRVTAVRCGKICNGSCRYDYHW